MASPPPPPPASNAMKHSHVTPTTISSTSLKPSVDVALAPSHALITIPVIEPSTDSTTDSPAPMSAAADDQEANSDSTSRKKGRGKVEMKKMEKESNLLVTFSKRRSGLFKKANEICTLCGVECAVVVFSPAGKVFSFGHPSVDTVVDRYLTRNLNDDQVPLNGDHPQQVQGADDIEYLTAELTDLMDAFELAKKNSQSLDKRRGERQGRFWFERPLQQMNLVQLDTLKQAMIDLKLKIYEQVGTRMKTGSSSSTTPDNTFERLRQNNEPCSSVGGFSSWWYNKQHNNEAAGPSGVNEKKGEVSSRSG